MTKTLTDAMDAVRNDANRLVDSFRVILMSEDTECGNEILCTTIAIKHALIVADEIIKIKNVEDLESLIIINHWLNVKEYLRKL